MATSNALFNVEITTQRLEAFSDGVFAIAITLLIIEIKVPTEAQLQHTTLAHYLLALWPKYFAYIFSFIIIGIYWANHHYLFKLFVRTDHYFNLLNILFLMSIAFLPFPTGVVGEYILDEPHRKTAIIFYSLGIYLPAMCWFIIWLYASNKKRIVNPRLSPAFVRALNWQYLLSNLLYLSALALSFFYPGASIIVNIALTLLYLLPPRKPEFIPHSDA
jgi:uncharacterized membrane protein